MRSRPTLLLCDDAFLAHDPGPRHPESPERLRRPLALLDAHPLHGLRRHHARRATPEEVLRVHSPELLSLLDAERGRCAQLDPDTAMSAGSHEAAWRAAGAAVQAVEAALSAEAGRAFALVRPPGHHARPDSAMGFCLLNNIAIAAEAALALGLERVLVLDWDVHHGNGTQEAFYGRKDVLYLSLHQSPYYPGTGSFGEVGQGEGAGFTVNCPLLPGQRDADYGAVFESLLLPIARAYRPEVVLVSAGFDAHEADPLGGMEVTERGFAAMCSAAVTLADELAEGRIALVLEGGYDLGGLSRSVHACLEVLLGRKETFPTGAGAAAAEAIRRAWEAVRPYWKDAEGRT